MIQTSPSEAHSIAFPKRRLISAKLVSMGSLSILIILMSLTVISDNDPWALVVCFFASIVTLMLGMVYQTTNQEVKEDHPHEV
jgi:uncharacterized membrane protein